ncbi:Ankyrin repeat domain-containing protein SOWAHC [Vulpes lagopus]
MEAPAELSVEAVLRFLRERGGRAPHAELVQRFRGALGGDPEQRALARARFKELVNAVATVRTDPADGSKFVHLKKRFLEGAPPDLPRASGAAEPEPSRGAPPEFPDGGPRSEAASPEASPAARRRAGRWGAAGRGQRELPRPNPRGPGPGPSEDPAPAPAPPPHGCAETDAGAPAGGGSTPRPTRQSLRDLVMGSSPQLKRSVCAGGGSPGSSSGGGRGKGGGDSDSASVASSSAEEESGGASVTLDPLEHAWMLSASDGKWDSLEGLLTCEPGLLAKRDFITGFTCLHWAAKHGRQELLAMLVNFANKHQLPVNINARTSGGYTALHLAAMHGHVEVVKLLVGAYDADVDIRDYSGKKASQYLSPSIAEEIKNLVGALDEDDGDCAAGGGGGRWRLSKVLPSHLITYKLSHVLEDGGDHHHHHHHHHLTDGWAGGKVKDPGRKAPGSSSGRIKPRLNKIRFRTQIIHTTPSFRDPEQPLEEEGEEEEEDRALKGHSSSFKLRPKSNVFG